MYILMYMIKRLNLDVVRILLNGFLVISGFEIYGGLGLNLFFVFIRKRYFFFLISFVIGYL